MWVRFLQAAPSAGATNNEVRNDQHNTDPGRPHGGNRSAGAFQWIARSERVMPRPLRPFWDLVDRSGECWLWTGAMSSGYGIYGGAKAHRVSFERARGPIAKGLFVCHHCDNPRCVRPSHLFAGTAAENNADRAAKGRSKGVFKSGPTHHAAMRRGESHWCARLSALDVIQIRERRNSGATTTELAARFGVHPSTISRIARGVWRQEVSL